MTSIDLRRRTLLRGLVAGGAGLGFTTPTLAAAKAPGELAFAHTHTGERVRVVYADGGRYLDEGLAELNRFLRDWRTGEVYPIDPRVLDVLHAARTALKPDGVFELISGYRSPKTNDALRSKSGGVAKRSLHMQGRALDVRLPGVETRDLRDFFLGLRQGGVGYYARSNFVHIDTGRVRRW